MSSTSSRWQNRQSKKSGFQAPGEMLAGYGFMKMAKQSPSTLFANPENSGFQAMK
jgi:hypothetical protein